MALRQRTRNDGGNIALMKRQRRKKPLTWWISAGLLAAFAGAILWFAWTAGLFVSDKVTAPQVKAPLLVKKERREISMARNPFENLSVQQKG